MKKILPALALALTLAACTPTTTTDNNQASSTTTERATFEWSAEVSGAGNDAAPTVTLTLKNTNTGEESYRTNCTGKPASIELEYMGNTSDASIQCWWMGGGDQYGVFGDYGGWNILHRTVDEEAGFGEWEVLTTL